MHTRRKIGLIICSLIALFITLLCIFLVTHQLGYSLFQLPVDSTNTHISISESRLFNKKTLEDGAQHIINDSSFMRGCTITSISYKETYPYGSSMTSQNQKDVPGTQASFVMRYTCTSQNSDTMSMSPADSIVWRLMYISNSSDGTGWKTITHGNG